MGTMILARHGNTFGPNDKVVWVGADSDLNLVDKGREQAIEIGRSIGQLSTPVNMILTGPLRRTQQTAEIAANEAGLDTVDISVLDQLREIDYGLWEGKSNDEIRSTFGSVEIDAWQIESIWPETLGWEPNERAIKATLAKLAEMCSDKTALVVTSNGLLRVWAKLLGIRPDQAKVNTGNMCLVAIAGDGSLAVKQWNVCPDQFDPIAT